MSQTTPAEPLRDPYSGSAVSEVTLSAEQLRAGVQRVPVEQVRFTTRIVTETRTLTVEVRREELVIERVPVQDGPSVPALEGSGETGGPVLTLVLREEVPEVVTRLVPVEEVRVYRDRVEGTEQVAATLRRERLEVTQSDLSATDPGRGGAPSR